MIHSVKAYKLLAGARGAVPAQINKVEETLLRLSQLVEILLSSTNSISTVNDQR